MRGSPLLRSIFILLLLAASAVVLSRLTAARSTGEIAPSLDIPAPETTASSAIPYRLLLSHEASEIAVTSGETTLSALHGTLPANPAIFLKVRWKTPPVPGEHRFAKLTLDRPGKPTLTHVFDASGDIDDLFELP